MLSGIEFGHYLSVYLGQLVNPSSFTGIFSGQLLTLQDIEEVDRTDEAVQTQVAPLSRRQLLNGELIGKVAFGMANLEQSTGF